MTKQTFIPTDSLHGWLTTRQAAPLLCNVNPATVRNHMTRGTNTVYGRLRLRGVILGGQYYTRSEWITEYLDQIRRATLPDPVEEPVIIPETPEELAERGRRVKARVAARLSPRRQSVKQTERK